jgi:hypothetical protein
MRCSLPDETRISQVHLRTRSVEGVLRFYIGLTALAPPPPLEERAGERRPVPSAVTLAAGLRPAVEPGILPGEKNEGQYQLAQPILME